MNHAIYLFPKMLYGNAAETMTAWDDLVNLAKRDVHLFMESFDSLELVDVACYPGNIVLSDFEKEEGTRRRDKHWRLNFVSGIFARWWKPLDFSNLKSFSDFENITRDIIDEFPTVSDAVNLQQRIILHGMTHLWFTIAMLSPNRSGPAISGREPGARDSFYIPLLRRIVHWLPEIVALGPRYYLGVAQAFEQYLRGGHGYECMLWAFVLQLVEAFRPAVEYENLLDLRMPLIYHWNIIEALLGEGIIRHSGDRFVLNE